MLKKSVSMLLVVVAIVGCMLLAGCEKNEVRTHHEEHVEKHVVSQDTIVE